MKNKNPHNLVSCFGLNSGVNDELFGETRLCQVKPKADAGQNAPKPPDRTPVPVEQIKPEEIEAAKKEEEKRIAEEAERKKEELKPGVEGRQKRERFRGVEGLPIPIPSDSTKPRAMEMEIDPSLDEPVKVTPIEINKIPDKPAWEMDQFLKIDLKDERDKLDRWTINVKREDSQINAQTWDHSTPEGLQKIYDDLKTLGIIDSSPDFYNTMFPVLRSAADPKNPWRGFDNGKYRPMFKSPADKTSRDEISGLGKDGVFLGGEAFIKAYDHLQYIRAQILIAQDKAQVETLSKQRKLDENFIADKTTGFVRDNLAAFQKAIRERDYATAGMYAVGIYAMYKVVGGLVGGGGHGEGGEGGIAKWLLWGSAIYAGNIFLKNAGYDVLKMAGFKDTDYDVKGTPMASLNNILSQSEYSEQMKDLDFGIVLRMSDTKLTTLQELFDKTNKAGGIQFIHPREFPAIFPDLKNEWSFKMGIGEQGLKDYIGMSNTKLGPNEKEYIRVGQQLYKLALAMRVVYDNTLHKDHEKYKGMTYDEALKGKVLSQSKVRHLMDAASDYAPVIGTEGIFSDKKRDEIEAQLNQNAFGEMPQEGFHLTEELGPGHFSGKLRSFPIVVFAEPDGFRIYLRNEYGKTYNRNPGRNYITKIPLTGPDKALKAQEAVSGVTKRVEKLLEPFEGVGGRSIVGTTLVYKGGQWQAKVILPGAKKFDVDERETFAFITPDAFGDGVALKTEGGVRISIKEGLDKQYPIALAVIPKIVDQKEFAALAVFRNAGLLRLEDPDPSDYKLTLVIGKNRMKLEVEYEEETTKKSTKKPTKVSRKFVVVGKDDAEKLNIEKSLVQNPAFAQEYIEALGEDEHFELNKNLQTLRDLIQKSAPEGFVKYFFAALFQQTANSPLDGLNLDSLSGSIPDYFTDMVLQTSKTEVMERLRRAVLNASTLGEVETARQEILQDFNDKLQGINNVISEENAKLGREGGNWDRDIFMGRVIDRVRKASCVSNAYAFAKSDFEYMVYSLPLPGFLTGKSDLSSASHKTAADLMGVFAYYTAHLDNHEFSPDSKTKKMINLDHLDYPPKPTPGITDITKDPALRGHLIVRYFEYVKNQIYNKAKAKDNLSLVPPASAVNFWDIKEFDQWAKKDGDYRTLDPLDAKPKFVHDPDVAHKPDAKNKIRFTELEMEIVKEFDDAVEFLRVEYGTDLNFHAIKAYLRLKAKDAGPTDQVGKFRIQKDSVTGKKTAMVWQWADTIGGLRQRSQQVQQIQGLVDQFLIKHIFENPEKFFTKPISLKARILRRWPYLRDIPLVPNWINPLN